MKIPEEDLLAEVILILHHVEDCMHGVKDKDMTYIEKGLKDIEEVGDRLKMRLSPPARKAVDGIAEAWVQGNCKFANIDKAAEAWSEIEESPLKDKLERMFGIGKYVPKVQDKPKPQGKREPYHSLDMHDGVGEDDGW